MVAKRSTLDELIEDARLHPMTPDEKRAQRVSLIMGGRSRSSKLTSADVVNYLADVEGWSDQERQVTLEEIHAAF
jgi:hypothetical protein